MSFDLQGALHIRETLCNPSLLPPPPTTCTSQNERATSLIRKAHNTIKSSQRGRENNRVWHYSTAARDAENLQKTALAFQSYVSDLLYYTQTEYTLAPHKFPP